MISKYKKTSCVIHKIQHLYVFAFLPILPASSHFSISEAKSLSSEHPQKPSTTTTIKHLAEERPIFVFINVTNPMEPHFLVLTNWIRAPVWFILGWFWPVEKSYRPKPTMFWQICQQLGFVHRCKMMSSTATCMSSKLPCGAMITRAASFICL